MKNRICVINCYWGPWPKWIRFFFESCQNNSEIDWLFFTDNEKTSVQGDNIKLVKHNIADFNSLASSKLDIKVEINDPYKVCDFKPAFGKIFEDFIEEYDFWGYCDLDIIVSKLSSFINSKLLNQYDIISFYSGFLSGPFCLYRNNDHIKGLFKQSVNFPAVYKSIKHFGFDENIQRSENLNISSHKIIKAIQFTFLYLLTGNFQISSWKEFRYQFQWFYKKSTIKPGNLTDMTEVVWFNSMQSKIKTYFGELMLSDRHFRRINYWDWEFIWDNGTLIEKRYGNNIMGFHFTELKNKPLWEIPDYKYFTKKFLITSKGIQIEKAK